MCLGVTVHVSCLCLCSVCGCAPAGKGIREAGSKALLVCQHIGALRMVRAVMEQMGRCVCRWLVGGWVGGWVGGAEHTKYSGVHGGLSRSRWA
jgi:hypothetical protein